LGAGGGLGGRANCIAACYHLQSALSPAVPALAWAKLRSLAGRSGGVLTRRMQRTRPAKEQNWGAHRRSDSRYKPGGPPCEPPEWKAGRFIGRTRPTSWNSRRPKWSFGRHHLRSSPRKLFSPCPIPAASRLKRLHNQNLSAFTQRFSRSGRRLLASSNIHSKE
jgi:hypothetical protein